jgi:hypothetical protein
MFYRFYRVILFLVVICVSVAGITVFAQTEKKSGPDNKVTGSEVKAKDKKTEKGSKDGIAEEDEIVLDDGRILVKPYIISRTPAGLNVGHESGVIFIPFSEMSEKRQKQYNYDPEKAKKYLARRAKARRQRQIRLAKKRAEAQAAAEDSLDYLNTSFGGNSDDPLASLRNELAYLVRQRVRLEKELSDVKSGRVLPRGGNSDDVYISYRGGKVYRKKRSNYAKTTTGNVNEKRRMIKELNGKLQRNKRRTTVVRNLISRAKTKGIKKGRTLDSGYGL